MPTTIGAILGSGPDYHQGASPNVSPYGFHFGGTEYAFIAETASGKVIAFKLVTGTWTAQDASSGPAWANGHSTSSFCVGRDGNTAYVICLRAHLNSGPGPTDIIDGVEIGTYDLLADLWRPLSGTIAIAGLALIRSRWVAMNLITRGPGDMLFQYSGSPNTSNNGTVEYSTFSGSGFGAGNLLPGQGTLGAFPGSGVVDSFGLTHFIIHRSSTDLQHVAMNSSGGFGTPDAVCMPYLSNINGAYSAPFMFTSGGQEYIGIGALVAGGSDAEVAFFYAMVVGSLSALTWTKSDVLFGAYGDRSVVFPWQSNDEVDGQFIAASASGSSVAVVWAWTDFTFDSTGFDYNKATFSTGTMTWTPHTTVVSAGDFYGADSTNAVNVWAWPIPGSIGVLGASEDEARLTSGRMITQFNSFVVGPPSGPANRYRPIW